MIEKIERIHNTRPDLKFIDCQITLIVKHQSETKTESGPISRKP